MPDTIIFYTEDGNSITLTDLVKYIVTDAKGQDMPPVSHLVDEIPGVRGTNFRQIKVGQRDVELKLSVLGASQAAILSNLRDLAQKIEPILQAGTIDSYLSWLREGAASARILYCRYLSGLHQFSSGLNPAGSLVFRAADPYWYGAAVTQSWTPATSTATFFPFFPMRVSHAALFQNFTITNAGDVESWPVWTITGAGADLSIYNLTTGKNLLTIGSISSGSVITIDTRPGAKFISDSNGNRLNFMILAGSSMWEIAKGANSIRIEMSGTDANSLVQLDYTPRYNAP